MAGVEAKHTSFCPGGSPVDVDQMSGKPFKGCMRRDSPTGMLVPVFIEF